MSIIDTSKVRTGVLALHTLGGVTALAGDVTMIGPETLALLEDKEQS